MESVTFGCKCGRSMTEPLPFSGHLVCPCGRDFFGDLDTQDGQFHFDMMARARARAPAPPPEGR